MKEKSCGIVILDDLDNVLVIKHNSGHFSFPKGHMELGESEIDTALREVKEEVNLDVNIINGFRKVITYSPCDGIIKDVVYFLGRCNNNNVILQEEEICDYKWISLDKSYDLITYDDDKDVIDEVKIFLDKR